MNRDAAAHLTNLVHTWDRAMIANDAAAIERYMADDWTIIGSDGGISDKGTFLELVRSGTLRHDVMESHELSVRVYGDSAVVIARGVSGGTYHGRPFREVERYSCVFLKQAGQWRCVATHLSRIDR